MFGGGNFQDSDSDDGSAPNSQQGGRAVGLGNGISSAYYEGKDHDVSSANVLAYLAAAQVNRQSQQETIAHAEELIDSLKISQDEFFEDMCIWAATIYKNGFHAQTRGDLQVAPGRTYGEMLKKYSISNQGGIGKKSNIVRFCVSIIKTMHTEGEYREENTLLKSAIKYDLQEDFDLIPIDWAFFGANYHPDITRDAYPKFLKFQRKLTAAAGGNLSQ